MPDVERRRGTFNQLKDTGIFDDVKRRVGEIGVAAAVREELEKAGVTINVRNESEEWETTSQPAIAVGDHSKGLECLLLVGACGMTGRNDLGLTAKPYAPTGQFINAISEPGENLLPLIPTSVAIDRKDGDFRSKVHRRAFGRYLLTKEEARAFNKDTMQRAVSMIEDEGRLVSIFPTGGVYDAAKSPWRNGVGHMAADLSKDTFEETAVLPFKFEGIRPSRILLAMVRSRLGLGAKPQHLDIVLGKAEMFGSIFHRDDDRSPANITQVLQERYQKEFAE